MKLNYSQITNLNNAGFSSIKYAALPNVDAISVYCLRREIVRISNEFKDAYNELMADQWEDKELLARARAYEVTKEGMTAEEYKAAIEGIIPKVQPLIDELFKGEKDIPVKPIAFESWLQLLKDNPFLAGWEDALADFIIQPE